MVDTSAGSSSGLLGVVPWHLLLPARPRGGLRRLAMAPGLSALSLVLAATSAAADVAAPDLLPRGAQNASAGAVLGVPPPPSGAWNAIGGRYCNLLSYSPIDTLDQAKYACSCDTSGACGGVYHHSGRPWTGAAMGKYYLCKREPLTCEETADVQVVYGAGPSVSCSWWNGTPNALTVTWSIGCSEEVPSYVWLAIR